MSVAPLTPAADRTPVVLIHGLGGFKEAWGALPRALLAAGARVISVDLPGFGAARPPRRRPGTGMYVAGLGPWVEEIGPAVLVGHSLGAQVALGVARRHPGAVSALALLSPVVVPRHLRFPRRLADVLAMPGAGPALARATIAAARRDPRRCRRSLLSAAGDPARLRAGSEEALLLDEAARRLRRTDLRALTAWASSGLRSGALVDAALCDAPAVIVSGDRDRLAPPADISRLRRAMPHARPMALPAVGHFPQLEDPGAVGRAVVAMLGPAEVPAP